MQQTMQQLRMRKHRTNGLLITFCGLDGCGKSTMIRMLNDWLEKEFLPGNISDVPIFQGGYSQDIFLTKQPTDFVRQTPIFRTYMDEPCHDAYDYRSLSLLAASDRLQHCNKVIFPELQKNKIVISDRYFYSCIANLRARGYESDRWIYEIAKSVIMPDIAFFLDIPVDAAVARVRSRPEEKERYINMELQYRLREEYLELAETNGGIVFSTNQTPEKTFAKIKNYIIGTLAVNDKTYKKGRG